MLESIHIGLDLLILASGIAVLWILKPFFGSYAREKGKHFATRQDIEEILEQTRRTTHEVELVKAQVSGDLWDRQMRWNLKRDLYIRLLENAGEMVREINERNLLLTRP